MTLTPPFSADRLRDTVETSTPYAVAAFKIINDPILIGELQAYESKRTASGFSYSAPDGMHDDTVMATAIAWDAISDSWTMW